MSLSRLENASSFVVRMKASCLSETFFCGGLKDDALLPFGDILKREMDPQVIHLEGNTAKRVRNEVKINSMRER